MNRILKKEPDFQITNAWKIVATRNRVIHGYDSVSEDVIWAIVVQELPKLEKEIDEYTGSKVSQTTLNHQILNKRS
ncbi:MAG: DUF86 domain-containing protein [Cyclobacteriaceae bacterium]|jgi:uncharacterized protein with HEPN domain